MLKVPRALRLFAQVVGFVVFFQLLIFINKPVHSGQTVLNSRGSQGQDTWVGNSSHDLHHLYEPTVGPTHKIENYLHYSNDTRGGSQSLRPKLRLDDLQTHVKVAGFRRNYTGFLTIGIPSVKRVVGPEYLITTLRSIIDQTTASEKKKTTVVIFLADADDKYNQEVLVKISELYAPYLSMGFIQMIQIPSTMYPKLNALKHNFNDSDSQVRWRAKQVADFAFMFKFSENVSKYYLQIEDDVVCAPNFVKIIEAFVEAKHKENTHWAVLEFSHIGFVGKLMKSEDLDKFAVFLMTFYEEQPVDWLLDYFRLTMAQKNKIARKPGLFEHMGKKSSFTGKKDWKIKKSKYFVKKGANADAPKIKSLNPPAVLISTMKYFENFIPENAYTLVDEIYWAVEPGKGDEVNIILNKAQKLNKIQIQTGTSEKPNDILRIGTISVSPEVIKMAQLNSEVECKDPKVVGQFEKGVCDIDVTKLDAGVSNMEVKCITINIKEDQNDWIIFKNMVVR